MKTTEGVIPSSQYAFLVQILLTLDVGKQAEHSLHCDQLPQEHGTGHLCRSHDLVSFKPGQPLPPCAGCLVTERDLVCVPPPHVKEQDCQLLHPETLKELDSY